MANDNISPEERLFKVIQESKLSPSGPEASGKQKIKMGPIRKFFSNGVNLHRIKRFFANLGPQAAAKQKPEEAGASIALPIHPVRRLLSNGVKLQEIDPKAINKVLIVILIVLTALVIHSAADKRQSIAKITEAVSKIQFPAIRKKAVESFKPAALYLEEIEKRDIFRPSPRIETEAAATAPRAKEASAKLNEMAKDLKVVGISWGASPKAMIKSEKEKNTYFLRQGQMLGTTGIEIKAIFKDKVVISYQGTEMELL